MGDVLHGLPAVAGLRSLLPGCRIGWAVEPHWGALLEGGGIVDRVHAVPTKVWRERPLEFETVGEIAALRREMRAEGYNVCVDLQGSVKSAVVGWLAGAGRRVGPDAPREGLARLLYGERVALQARQVTAQACELVSAAARMRVAAAAVELPVDGEAEAWCTAALARMDAAEGFVLLVPTAGWGAKEWGTERFGELGVRLRRRGLRVLVNGFADDVADDVARLSGGAVVRSSVAQLVALTRRAGLVVGGDTGPVHLAAALGRPVVTLFGPTDPERNGPYFPGAKVTVLRDASSVTSYKRSAATEAGLARITVDAVEAAAGALLGGWGR